MEKRWAYKENPNADAVENLSRDLNINSFLAALLVQRNIDTFDKAKAFFRPSLDDLHDPFLMKDMDKAVTRLTMAMKNREKILIYGDYDVDGTTAVSLVYGYLQKKYDLLEFYIPDRYSEGYGISWTGIEWAAENNFSLIISLDCGIKSVEYIRKAKDKFDIDFIVCDHHKPGETLPPAAAVLDPKREDCPYPFKELSGCGVGFKLLQALCLSDGISQEDLYPYLDLVAVSIASDIVPIIGENRILCYYGLKTLNSNPRPGMKALIDVAGFKRDLNISNVVFGLGPRINAAGRIAHAKTAVHLMLSFTEEDAGQYARQINEKNTIRKDFDTDITAEALEMIRTGELLTSSKSTVLFKNDWHKGVIGIVASRCIEKYYRPTIILTKNNEYATGSARSVFGFDVYEAISQCAELLEQFGGHTYAAGLTLKLDNLPAFKKKFEEVVAGTISEDQLIPRIDIDLKLDLKNINYKFYNILSQMGPFGPFNMQPVFVTDNVYDTGSSRLLKDKHLKLSIKQEDSQIVEAVGFDMAEHFSKIKSKERFSICYTIGENEYNGTKTLQLFLKDIKYKA